MPWRQVPQDRRAVFIEPNLPRGGLLGGSPGAAPPKMSKLQAMAAARKKKAEEQKRGSSLEAPLSELELGGSPNNPDTPNTSSSRSQQNMPQDTQMSSVPQSQQDKLQAKKRKNSGPHEKTAHISERPWTTQLPEQRSPSPPLLAAPSAFANAMFSNRPIKPTQPPGAVFTLPYVRDAIVESTNAFTEPSPDDLVLAAQAKGSTISAKHR